MKKSRYYLKITKKKLTKTQMKKLGLKYDGWGKEPHKSKVHFYVKMRKV